MQGCGMREELKLYLSEVHACSVGERCDLVC